jgi:hypothetical protein
MNRRTSSCDVFDDFFSNECALRDHGERCEAVNFGPVNVKVLQPKEFPERKQPYVVRWRLNGRRYWRSFATRRGNNGADTFCSILTVATINERDWNSETGLPTSWDSKCEIGRLGASRPPSSGIWT